MCSGTGCLAGETRAACPDGLGTEQLLYVLLITPLNGVTNPSRIVVEEFGGGADGCADAAVHAGFQRIVIAHVPSYQINQISHIQNDRC